MGIFGMVGSLSSNIAEQEKEEEKRMKILTICRMFVAVLLLGTISYAHAQSNIKPVTGEVVSIEGDDLKLKTELGVRTIMLAQETKYLKNNKPVTLKSVKPGDVVIVAITKIQGDAIAEEISIQGSQATKSQ